MDKIEQRICDIIDQHRDEIIEFGRDIWHHAEMGYKEFRTAKKFEEAIAPYCKEVQTGLAITGVKGYLKEKKEDEVMVSIMGELDALPIPTHPDANPETGASHCCGHNAQITGVFGSAFALADEEVKASLGGNIAFFAVPAEEFVDIEFKNNLIKEGKISYGGGKCELIGLGALDDIDVTIGHHIDPGCGVRIGNAVSNGFVNKTVKYVGKASHAAGSPEKGIDALAAAELAMHAINLQRESFRDEDAVRVHGFVSHGGTAMNVIADTVTMEHSVRANNVPAFLEASEKFDRAIKAGALASGCGAEIVTLPGYLPTIPAKDTSSMKDAMATLKEIYPDYEYDTGDGVATTGSTDFGDLSNIMPLLQFKTGGYRGVLHNANMLPIDEELAYIVTAKMFALTAYHLLKNGAEKAKSLVNNFEQHYTKETYVEYMDSVNKTEIIDIKPLKSQL